LIATAEQFEQALVDHREFYLMLVAGDQVPVAVIVATPVPGRYQQQLVVKRQAMLVRITKLQQQVYRLPRFSLPDALHCPGFYCLETGLHAVRIIKPAIYVRCGEKNK
jgi:hypothetical protein